MPVNIQLLRLYSRAIEFSAKQLRQTVEQNNELMNLIYVVSLVMHL